MSYADLMDRAIVGDTRFDHEYRRAAFYRLVDRELRWAGEQVLLAAERED
jgi:hypothetical protein